MYAVLDHSQVMHKFYLVRKNKSRYSVSDICNLFYCIVNELHFHSSHSLYCKEILWPAAYFLFPNSSLPRRWMLSIALVGLVSPFELVR